MSSRRSSRTHSGSSRITDDQIVHLISKLQQVLPNELGRGTRRSEKVSGPGVLQEICNHIRSLHRKLDDLSERLSHVLATLDADSPEASIIRSLLDV